MSCRICGGATRHVFDLHSQRHQGVTVPVFRCRRCDAYFTDGGPVNYDDVDLTAYYLGYAEAIKRRYQRVFAQVQALAKPGRFLDIGAGMGFSLEVAQQQGWTSQGLEPNRSLVRHAHERGLAVVGGYLDDSRQGEYDFILVDNVLEHVPDPAGFLRNARRLLAPSGLLVVAIPPMDWLRKALGSLSWVRTRVNAPQLNIFGEVDEHLNMLGRRAMARLIHGAGLKLLPIRFHHSPVYDNPVYRAFALDDGYYFTARA
ncbi:class I SAM-dependent methyltransferase [Piscinibacter sp. XHJ-5]|uniref:class I SAM-dependent methyltransferase n=1 Tax=Piscinibacter sp. XHJ-5 TaxID=3037797 RepID=UPI002452C9CC|nr:class I SAM-dependent methyltransferase [Piscinibacter sp. XHJ-5]